MSQNVKWQWTADTAAAARGTNDDTLDKLLHVDTGMQVGWMEGNIAVSRPKTL